MVSIVRLGVGRETTPRIEGFGRRRRRERREVKTKNDTKRRRPTGGESRAGEGKEQAAKETAGKMELGDVDEEYYQATRGRLKKASFLLSRTLALRCPKGFAFIKSSEFEQFKENWQEMKRKKKSQGSMANGGVDPMSWRSGIFDRHKVAVPYSGGGQLLDLSQLSPFRNRQYLRQLYQQRKRWILPSSKKWRRLRRRRCWQSISRWR